MLKCTTSFPFSNKCSCQISGSWKRGGQGPVMYVWLVFSRKMIIRVMIINLFIFNSKELKRQKTNNNFSR